MRTLQNRRETHALSALLVTSLIGLSGTALADDAEGPAPEAPPNVATPAAEPAEANEGTTSTSADFSRTSERPSYEEEPNFDAETTRQTWPNVPMLSTGATVFGVSYLPAVIGGAVANAPNDKDLYIPVAGPFLMLTNGPEEKRVFKALLITDGVVQGLGALMMVTSFFVPEKTTKHWYLIGSNDLRVAPSNVGTGYGLGAAGRF